MSARSIDMSPLLARHVAPHLPTPECFGTVMRVSKSVRGVALKTIMRIEFPRSRKFSMAKRAKLSVAVVKRVFEQSPQVLHVNMFREAPNTIKIGSSIAAALAA